LEGAESAMKLSVYEKLIILVTVAFIAVVAVIYTAENMPGLPDKPKYTAVKPVFISINRATRDELMELEGIGQKTADGIIEYREKHGYFKSVDELLNVKGISRAVLEKNKSIIRV
jgi:comEA protein